MNNYMYIYSGVCCAVLTGKQCSLDDPRVYNASRFLLKLGEHTLGLNNVRDTVNWTNAAFAKAKSGHRNKQCCLINPEYLYSIELRALFVLQARYFMHTCCVAGKNFHDCVLSWQEQRNFTYLAIDALQNHSIVPRIHAKLQELKPAQPDLTSTHFTCKTFIHVWSSIVDLFYIHTQMC